MARPKKHWPMVSASRDEAMLAVRLFNDPAEVRSFEGFVVHMHLAWLYLLHAELTQDGVDFRYRRKDNPRLLERVDGEPKRWELARCVKELFSENDPVRVNLEFFIGLRNRIEHRYARQQQALNVALGGHAQALLLNFEEHLIEKFGVDQSLATQLRFPVFIGSFTDEGLSTLQRLRRSLPASLRTFISEYYSGLTPETEVDRRFEFRLRVMNELAPKDPDALAIQYTRYDDMTPDQRAVVDQLGRKGLVVVREQSRPVANHDLLAPKAVVTEVSCAIPYRFTMAQFVRAWQKLDVRPSDRSATPQRTDERYCVYDSRHRDYSYTSAYVRLLIRKCSTAEGYMELLGSEPVPSENASSASPKPVPSQRSSTDAHAASQLIESCTRSGLRGT